LSKTERFVKKFNSTVSVYDLKLKMLKKAAMQKNKLYD